MKLRVCVSFDDKYTGETYPAGAEIEVTEERGAEILRNPQKLAEAVEAPAQKSAPAPKRKRGVSK